MQFDFHCDRPSVHSTLPEYYKLCSLLDVLSSSCLLSFRRSSKCAGISVVDNGCLYITVFESSIGNNNNNDDDDDDDDDDNDYDDDDDNY